jgi:two-component system sensor histidine kinase KdpD
VAVDAAAVAEVIYMLLDNASKYAPENTAIRVAAAHSDARHVTIEVTDEGPGVPPALRERVFEKFYRVPGREPADSNRAGIGLGLPIARRLIEAQGGRIWIQSAGGAAGGTAVMMSLPGAAAPAAADAVPQSSPAVTT